MKKCPYCAEEIQDEAILCRYCGSDLTKPVQVSPAQPEAEPEPQPATEAAQEQPKKKNYLTPVIVAIVIVCGALWLLMRASPNVSNAAPTMSAQENAWYTCVGFIEQELKIPGSSAQRYAPEKIRTPAYGQFVVDVYYASLDATYRCEMETLASGGYHIVLTER